MTKPVRQRGVRDAGSRSATAQTPRAGCAHGHAARDRRLAEHDWAADPEAGALRGKSARKACPRASHSQWEAPADRRDPVEILRGEDEGRVAELVPIRHERMSSSAFAFFRGSASVMAEDLARTPASGLAVQLCGDAHLSNFGGFGSPDRSLVFDINDFDETLPGPWEWDVKRLAASMEIAGRNRGFDDRERRVTVRSTVAAYRGAMREFADLGHLQVWYSRMTSTDISRSLGG